MRTRHIFALAASAIAFAAPTLSLATSEFHSIDGEVGYVQYPGHVQSLKSKAEVRAQLEVARKDGSLTALQRGFALPAESAGRPKTRAEVLNELHSESPEQRRARMESYSGG